MPPEQLFVAAYFFKADYKNLYILSRVLYYYMRNFCNLIGLEQ